MYTITDLKPGVMIELEDGQPYLVIFSQHTQLGRGGGIMKTTLKNLETGATIERVFKGEVKIKEANLEKIQAQFLYKDEENFYFMDNATFEQFPISSKQIGDNKYFLIEGQNVEILSFKGRPINVSIPPKVKLKVIETEPGVRGDTVSSPTKPAILETGLKINVPLFIKVGDEIIINTREFSYVERA